MADYAYPRSSSLADALLDEYMDHGYVELGEAQQELDRLLCTYDESARPNRERASTDAARRFLADISRRAFKRAQLVGGFAPTNEAPQVVVMHQAEIAAKRLKEMVEQLNRLITDYRLDETRSLSEIHGGRLPAMLAEASLTSPHELAHHNPTSGLTVVDADQFPTDPTALADRLEVVLVHEYTHDLQGRERGRNRFPTDEQLIDEIAERLKEKPEVLATRLPWMFGGIMAKDLDRLGPSICERLTMQRLLDEGDAYHSMVSDALARRNESPGLWSAIEEMNSGPENDRWLTPEDQWDRAVCSNDESRKSYALVAGFQRECQLQGYTAEQGRKLFRLAYRNDWHPVEGMDLDPGRYAGHVITQARSLQTQAAQQQMRSSRTGFVTPTSWQQRLRKPEKPIRF